MRYMLMIHSEEKQFASMSPQEIETVMKDYYAFSEEIAAAGVVRGSDRLCPTSSATTVRVQGGTAVTTDGPFAETKEQMGGYYEIDVADLDAAIAWAAKIPSAKFGCVEIRPIWEPEDYEVPPEG